MHKSVQVLLLFRLFPLLFNLIRGGFFFKYVKYITCEPVCVSYGDQACECVTVRFPYVLTLDLLSYQGHTHVTAMAGDTSLSVNVEEWPCVA